MYCQCGEKWCDARNQCSVDLGVSAGGHRKVGGSGCGSTCEMCHPELVTQDYVRGWMDSWTVAPARTMGFGPTSVTWDVRVDEDPF